MVVRAPVNAGPLGGDRSTSRRRYRAMIKLVLFIMDHISWVYLGVLVSVGAIASQTSIALAVLLVFSCGVALHAFLHNSNPLTPWLREPDDQVLFHACRSPDLYRARRLYRRLPSDQRCRLCLVPLGGVGKLLRIGSHTKNPTVS